MPRRNRKPEIIQALSVKGADPIKVAQQFAVTPSYVYHLDKKRRGGESFAEDKKASLRGGGPLFQELSVSSLKRHGGDVAEEYLRELQGQRGIELYKEMGNDPVIAAVLHAIKMTIRRIEWYAVAPKSGREEEVDFLNECMDDMSLTFSDFIDQALSMLQYGFAPFEIVYKLRKGDGEGRPGPKTPASRYDDGKIGWRKFCLIGQDTLAPGNNWWFDDKDGSLKGVHQMPPMGTPIVPMTMGKQMFATIPIEKMILFRTTTEKGNPEGRSILRPMYGSWFYAKNMTEIEAISAERMGAGFPVIYLGEDISKGNAADSEIAEYRKMGRNIRIDEQMCAIIPSAKMGGGAREGTGVLLEFLSPNGRSQVNFGMIIERHERRMAMTGLAQMIHLGMGQYGSQSLADVTTDFFQLAVSGWADSMRDTINRFATIPLLRLNRMDTEDPVIIDHGQVSPPSLSDIADYINKTVGAKVIEPDDQLEAALRRIAALPEKDEATVRSVMVELDGDGGTRMNRGERTTVDTAGTSKGVKAGQDGKPANQRNMRPKTAKPKSTTPSARKPMRASEDVESEEFADEDTDMNTREAMEFAERIAGKAIDGVTKMAEAKSQPINVSPTIQNYDMKPVAEAVAEAISKIPPSSVTVEPAQVNMNVNPTPIVFNAPPPIIENTTNVNVDTTPIAKEMRAGFREMFGNWIEKFADMVRGQQHVINVQTPPAQVIINDSGPSEMEEEQTIIRDRNNQMIGTTSKRKYKK